MRIFIWIILLFVISCGQSPDSDKASDKKSKNKNFQGQDVTKNIKGKRKKKRHALHKKQELSLQKKLNNKKEQNDNLNPICRRYPGCIAFCSKWNTDSNCTKWSAQFVAELWSNNMDRFSDEQILEVAEWVAKNSFVNSFLQNTNHNQTIMKKIISRLSEQDCPLPDSSPHFHYQLDDPTAIAIYISSPDESNRKKVVDTQIHSFDLSMFKGLVSRCLNDRTLSFLEYAVKNDNATGFLEGHRLLVHSCGEAPECARATYCQLDSRRIWKELHTIAQSQFPGITNVDIRKCEYADFQSLPEAEAEVESQSAEMNDSLMSHSFVVVNKTIPSALFEIRYHSDNNFIGKQINGYQKPLCILTQPASLALEKVQQEISQQGYLLKIFDCYRPQQAVDHFVQWVGNAEDQKMKSQYYPKEEKSQLIQKGYIADQSGHSRGSTLDLTLVKKSDLKELDMGTPYDYFDTLSHTADSRISEEQKQNRLLLKTIMEKHGFVNYEKEWWHYTLKDEPYPDTYFNFPVK